MELIKMKNNKENIPLVYELTSGDDRYDDLYFFLINNMSFNYVFNLYLMIKEKLENLLPNGSNDND